MRFIFKDSSTSTGIALPVTPKDFQVSSGIKVEIINIHTIGDVAVGGYGTLDDIKINCMFPLQNYPFARKQFEPYEYINKFDKLCKSRRILRLIITETQINIPVMLSGVAYGERDGTGDVYATLSMREYKHIAMPRTQKVERTQNNTRPEAETSSAPKASESSSKTHIVVKGNTMWGIAKKYYGDGNLCWKLASYNGIKNANLIYPGQKVKIPDRSKL